jgi:hypothetical protein
MTTTPSPDHECANNRQPSWRAFPLEVEVGGRVMSATRKFGDSLFVTDAVDPIVGERWFRTLANHPRMIPGTDEKLRYRGGKDLGRNKGFAYHPRLEALGLHPKYEYPGAQNVLLDHAVPWTSFQPLDEVLALLGSIKVWRVYDDEKEVRELVFCGSTLNHAIVSHYRDGNDRITFHRDKQSSIHHDSYIPILSLGAARPMHFCEHRGDAKKETPEQKLRRAEQLVLAPCSLFLLAPETNRTHEHAIMPVATSGPRVSVIARHITTLLTTEEKDSAIATSIKEKAKRLRKKEESRAGSGKRFKAE